MTKPYGEDGDLVARMLRKSRETAAKTAELAGAFSKQRAEVRSKLLVDHISEVDPSQLADVAMPTISAVDGGMARDSRAIGDICAAVAVAVGPGRSQRNEMFLDTVPRRAHNEDILRGVMAAMEIMLAASSDAEIVFVDGSLVSGLINISKAISHSKRRTTELESAIMDFVSQDMRDAVMELLTSKRHVAVPKYTTDAKDFVSHLPSALRSFDGKTVATMALKPGEMIHVFNEGELTQEQLADEKRRIGNALKFSEAEYGHFLKAVTTRVHAYYRPHAWTPAFRIEVPYALHNAPNAGRTVLKALRESTLSPGMREPLPLYVADLFAKQVSIGVSAIAEVAAVEYSGDHEALLLMIMGYRT